MKSARPIWTRERGVLWAIELNVPPPRVEARLNTQVGEVGVESFSALASAMGAANPNEIRERFVPGRCCYAAYAASRDNAPQIAAYGWVSRCPEYIGEQEREIKLGADEAYIWDCATLPSFRNQHLYSALLSHINRVLYDEKVRRVFIGSSSNNHASLRGFGNAGFCPVIEVTYTRFLNLRVTQVVPQPKAPLELVDAARRVWS